jgi:hypothetical protein
MSEYEISRRNSTKKTYSPDSNNDFEELIDDKNCSMIIDNNNIIMKTPQSLDDLLDVDDNHIENEDGDDEEEEEDKEENENVNDNDDNDSTHSTIDHSKTTEQTKQKKKSNEKNGKI